MQKIDYEELSTTEKLNSDLTAVGLSDLYTKLKGTRIEQ